uniref:Uncharacterized protein n=1 Tax=Aegilops tauschii TaxID=37682 RepID=R7WEQ6_AEGTA
MVPSTPLPPTPTSAPTRPSASPNPRLPPDSAAGGYQQQQQKQPYAPADPYYAQGYQAAPGYGPVVQGRPVEGRPVRMRRLPCCGLGMGWLL